MNGAVIQLQPHPVQLPVERLALNSEDLGRAALVSTRGREHAADLVFLRKLVEGGASRSYGIEVARLAGLPRDVIERAREILDMHEKTEHEAVEELSPKPRRQQRSPMQIQLFEPVNYEIAGRIRSLDLDNLRPIEALQLLAELQKELNRQ